MSKLLLIALWIWLTLVGPAGAAPVIGAIGALVGAWSSAGLLVKIVVGLAVNIGMSLIEQARARKAAANRQSGVKLTVQMGDDVARSYLLGLRATAGIRRYIGVWGAEGGTPNAYLVDVRELSCLPSRAGPAGLQAVRIGDKAVTVLWAEPHADGRGYPVQEYRANGVDYLWIKYLDGTQTAPDAYLRAKFGAHADRPWKASMIGRGCQAVVMTLRYNADLYKQGLLAALFAPAPMPLYDLRKDTTAGGSGPQRWNDPATWTSSDNLAVMAYNVARGIHYGGRWVHGGRNFAAHRLPASAWMAAINEADRAMGSGRRQFRGGLEVAVEETGLDVLEKIRLGCAGRFSEVGGALKLLVGAPAAAVYAISDETIVVTREQDFQPFPSLRSVCNTIRATYPEPAQGWAMKDAPARSSAALVARDGGQELAVDVAFEAVDDVAQVQCLTKTMIDEEQRWRRHQIVLPPSARPLEPGDVVAWSSERSGYGDKKFIVAEIARLAGCLWRVVLEEIDPSDYDPPSVILPKVTGPTGVIPIPEQDMDGWTAVAASIDDDNGVPRRPGVRVSCAAELDDVEAVHVQIRVRDTGQVVYDDADATPYPEPGTGGVYSWLLSGAWAVPDLYVQVRGKYVPQTRRKTKWSGWIEVKLLPLRLTDDDVYLPGMLADINAVIADFESEMGEEVDDILADLALLQQRVTDEIAEVTSRIETEQAERVDNAIEGAERWRYVLDRLREMRDYAVDAHWQDFEAREEIRRSLTLALGAATASFDERITVAVSETAAVAERTVQLAASVGDLSAAVTTVETAYVAGDEALAQQIAHLAAGNVNQFDYVSIWYFDTDVEGWTGNGTPTVAGGYLRPANHASSPYVVSPPVDVASVTYGQVRARLRRTGTPEWRGQLWWRTAAQGWDEARRTTIAEPVWDADSTAPITFNPPWSTAGQIVQIRLDLTAAQSAENAVEIDWVAIGRPSPGASAAELAAERVARQSAEAATAHDLLVMQAQITSAESGLSAVADGLSLMEATVETIDGEVTAHGTALTALGLEVAGKAGLDLVNEMSGEIETIENGLSAQGGVTTAVRAGLVPAAMETVDQDFANFLGRSEDRAALAEASSTLNTKIDLTNNKVDLLAEAIVNVSAELPGLASASALSVLTVRVTASEGSIVSIADAITTLNNELAGKASIVAVNGLTTRIEEAEGTLTVHGNAITSLTSSLNGKASVSAVNQLNTRLQEAEGEIDAQSTALTNLSSEVDKKASATAVNSLSTRVTTAEGKITAQSNALIALNASDDGRAATARFRINTQAAPSGYSVRIAFSGRTGSADNYRAAGFFLDIPERAGAPSRFVVRADQFVVSTSGSSTAATHPVLVFSGGVLRLAGGIKVDWADIDYVDIDWADIEVAVIDNLVVGTSNLDFDSVTASYQMQRSVSSIAPPSAWTLVGTALSVANPNPNPMLCDINLTLSVSVSGAPAAQGVSVETQLRIKNNTTGEIIYEDAISVTGNGSGSPKITSRVINVFRFAMDNAQGNNQIRVEWRVTNPGFIHAGSLPAAASDVRMLLWKR